MTEQFIVYRNVKTVNLSFPAEEILAVKAVLVEGKRTEVYVPLSKVSLDKDTGVVSIVDIGNEYYNNTYAILIINYKIKGMIQ